MSKIDYTEHACDVCGKGFRVAFGTKTNQKLNSIEIPSKNYDCEGRNYSKGQCKVDMCDECYDKFWEFVNRKYNVSNTISEISIVINGD